MKAPKFKEFISEKVEKSNIEVAILTKVNADSKSVVSNMILKECKRRNTIAQLLGDWGLVAILNKEIAEKKAPLSQIKVLSFKEKGEWDLQAKYNIGKKVEPETTTEPIEPIEEITDASTEV